MGEVTCTRYQLAWSTKTSTKLAMFGWPETSFAIWISEPISFSL